MNLLWGMLPFTLRAWAVSGLQQRLGPHYFQSVSLVKLNLILPEFWCLEHCCSIWRRSFFSLDLLGTGRQWQSSTQPVSRTEKSLIPSLSCLTTRSIQVRNTNQSSQASKSLFSITPFEQRLAEILLDWICYLDYTSYGLVQASIIF